MMCFSLLFIVACDAYARVVSGLLLIFLSFSHCHSPSLSLYFDSQNHISVFWRDIAQCITTASSAVFSSLSTFFYRILPLIFFHIRCTQNSLVGRMNAMQPRRWLYSAYLVYAWARVHEHEHMKWRRYSYLPQTLRRAIHISCSLFCLQSTFYSHTHHTQCGRSCVFQSRFFLSDFFSSLFLALGAYLIWILFEFRAPTIKTNEREYTHKK